MKRILKLLLITALLLNWISFPVNIYGQDEEVKDAIEALSKITEGSGLDRTSKLLYECEFIVPESLKPHFNAFPAYRKIETAYWAAEKTGSGKNFLALLSNKLAQEFESVYSEKSLLNLLKLKVSAKTKIVFGSFHSLDLPAEIPSEISASLLAITKYTDAKALGGTRGILKYHFNLPDDKIYKLLRESPTNFDALLSGISAASIPPSQKERIKNIIMELRATFESANVDPKFSKIIQLPKSVKDQPGTKLKSSPPIDLLQAEYDEFVKKNHTTPKSKKFHEMRKNPDGFGGIIFGNIFTVSKSIPKLKNVIWIHSDNTHSSGILELNFHDGTTKVLSNLLWEDCYAAYTLVFGNIKKPGFNNHEGVGFVGAYYPDVYADDKIYDSLIRSHNLNDRENRYYVLYSGQKRVLLMRSNKIKDDILRINKLVKSLKKAEEEYDLTAYRSYQSEGKKLFKEYIEDTAAYNLAVRAYKIFDSSWRKMDSMTVTTVHRYISNCNKIVLHPSIANLELGRSLVRADVLPRTGQVLIEQLKTNAATANEIKICEEWLAGSDSVGWKFSDDTLRILSVSDFIHVERKKHMDQASRDGVLNFNKITTSNGKTSSIEIPKFELVLPLLTNSFYDYYRLNNFAKIITLFRWIKQNGSAFLNKPKTPPLYTAPAYLIISNEGKVNLVDR